MSCIFPMRFLFHFIIYFKISIEKAIFQSTGVNDLRTLRSASALARKKSSKKIVSLLGFEYTPVGCGHDALPVEMTIYSVSFAD